jgi:nucleoside-diphosphate-sugar epimerase
VEAGREVTIFHRGEHEADLPDSVRHVHGDFARWDDHVDELRALEPEVVVDMVPFVREDARRLLSFAGVARRGVAVSSGDVYLAFGRLWRTEPGDPVPLPLTEDSPLRSVVVNEEYDKVGVEEEYARGELPVTVVRAPAIHGPNDEQHRLHQYVKRMDDGRPAIVLDDRFARWRWVRGYCEDAGHAIALAATHERAAGRTYNVAEPESMSEEEWVRVIADVVGWDGEVLALPPDRLPETLRADAYDLRQDYVVDSTRIREELGYDEIVDPDEAIRRTIEWERAHPGPVDPARFDYAAEDAAIAAAV